MGVSSPDPRYFKDGSGLRPNWRYALKWPKRYLWMVSPRWFKSLRFAVQRWRRGAEPMAVLTPLSRDPDAVEFTIRVSMQRRWVPHFLGMLKTMQRLGGIGASRAIVFYADGDGDFRPRFEWDTEIEPVEREEQRLAWPDGREGYSFDAG